jgi:branched-chain amino acid transport system substrate-binding protein
MRPLPCALALLCLAGCSFTVASPNAFHECDVDQDCKDSMACVEHFCVGNRVPDGCGKTVGEATTDATLHLGAVLPLTYAEDGGMVEDPKETTRLNAIQLALEEINMRKISGRPVVLHVCDSHRSAEEAAAQADWLVRDTGSVALLTAGSTQTLAVSGVTIPAGVVTLSFSATSPELSSLAATREGSSRLVWRTAPSDAIQGRVMAGLVKTDARFASVKKIGVLYLNDTYGQGLKDAFIGQVELPLVVRGFQYERGGDVNASMQELNTYDPDLTVIIAFPDDAVKVLKQVASLPNLQRSAGHQWLFSDSAKSSSLLTGLSASERAEVEGAYGTVPAQGAGRAYQSFEEAYTARFSGQKPSQYSFTAHAYDAAYCLSLAMAAAIRDGTGEVSGATTAAGLTRLSKGTSFELRASQFLPATAQLAAGNTVDVDGASGSLNFDPLKGEAPGKIQVWSISGTTFTEVRVVEP